MGKINILPSHIANKIAAGEVVERPSSIVKELIENSIDGNSTNITINVQNAGKDKIEIIDNGIGMDKDDVPLAFMRHATSKISEAKDLEMILSLGFRGEALPSIAAVSKVTVLTRKAGEDFGIKYKIEGGVETYFDVAAANIGTRIIIEDLFFNTPARKKFLKTNGTELGYVTDLVSRFIMSYPEISFQLSHNSRVLLKSSGDDNLKYCLSEVMGLETAENSIEVNYTFENMTVSGLIIKPVITKSARTGQMFFINNRIVRSTMLSKALESGYNTLLPLGRYPQAVLNVSICPSELDVNVHPSKQEIKFKNEKQVFALIKQGVENSLRNVSLVSEFKHTNVSKQLGVQSPYVDDSNKEAKRNEERKEGNFVWKYQSKKEAVGHRDSLKALEILTKEEEHKDEESHNHSLVKLQGEASTVGEFPTQQAFELPYEEQLVHPFFNTLNVIGQYANTYLICLDKDQIYFIDQHAAQEKIYYEKAIKQLSEKPMVQQIIPLTLALKAGFKEKLMENIGLIEKLGFDIDFLDGNTVIVRGLPFFINKTIGLQILFDSLEELIYDNQLTSLKKFKEAILALISCKGAIKANHKLTQQEMEQLVKDLGKISNPYSCPHGRPVLISLDKYSIEKLFKRVM